MILVASAVALAATFAALGQWQLRRAGGREALERQFTAFTEAPELEFLPDANATRDSRYRRVALQGRYLPQTQVLLDNMIHAGVVGYHVLTPFLATDGRVVVVNRGFVPAPPTRSELPDVAVRAEELMVRGRIDTLPTPALRLSGEDQGTGAAVRVMSFPDPEDLEEVLGRSVVPYQILLDPVEPDGFLRAWEPSGSRAERNLAYAGQWFALSVATLVAAIALLVKARFGKRSSA
jgi:surfeit locus 1 family protein